jgi:Fe(3+) dicitrate transport protein
VIPHVDVVGRAPRALEHIPGSAAVVRREDIRQISAQSASDVLRTVPGINIVNEDGAGLRLNLGIRGLDPNRSRKTLILEDGVPVTLNPYGSPEAYYSPAIERMDRIEVVKGSGQILWGPQTVGGLVNYITRDPPRKLGGSIDLRYGSFGYLLAQGGIGATHGPVGWRLDIIHRRFGGPRRLNLAVTDVSGKVRVQFSPTSILTVKLGFYDERSSATYIGLTTPQFEANPSLNLATNDRFLVRRYAVGLSHQKIFSEKLLLQTNFYAYQTGREWRRQEYDREDLGLDYERICDRQGRCGSRGDPTITPSDDGSSIFYRRSVAHRNRAYTVAGIEPRVTWNWSTSRALSGELVGLVRFHYERGRDQIQIGSFPTSLGGEPIDDEIRIGYAFAAAIQHRFTLWERFQVTPGLRFENFWSSRNVVRQRAAGTGPAIVGQDVNFLGRAFSYAVIPALGLSFDVARPFTLYAGVHRGYSPPRTRDAVSPSGQNLQLKPELSWNAELGARVRLGRWLLADVAAFLIEFQNQIIPPSDAGGAVGENFSSGPSRHLGLEGSVTFDIASLLRANGFNVPLTVNYTYLPVAVFLTRLQAGNRLPYAPEHLLWAQIRLAHRTGASLQFSANYVSGQFSDRENTLAPSLDGLIGLIPGYVTLDARVAYTIRPAGLTLYVSGKNLTNQKYISNRAPEGIQPAGFRQIFGGIEGNW